jgi:hypothetical protein
MSRIDRLKEYAKPTREANWNGAGRDQANIDRWSERATDNSKLAPRATNHEIKLPDTDAKQQLNDTKSSPRTHAEIDERMRGRNDLNHEGSEYLKSIRRT